MRKQQARKRWPLAFAMAAPSQPVELKQEVASVRREVECLQGTAETSSNIPVLQKLKGQIDSFSDDKGKMWWG